MSAKTEARTFRVSGRSVELSRAEKVLFPDDGITKADLAEYYRAASARMLPQLRGRPLMLERHPDGIGDAGFMQKDVPDYFPDWIHRVELPKEGGTVSYPLAEDAAALVYLVGQGCTTLHRFLSRADRPDDPDRIVFDLDPPGDDFAPVREAALRLRPLLEEELRLPTQVMTTGSRGLHVIVPLDGRSSFDEAREFARGVAEVLAGRYPESLTTAPRKQARKGRLYLDVQRNGYGQTAVTPYAVRARPGAPIAAPITWEDVEDPELGPRRWTLADADALLADDPWSPSPRGRSLAAAARRLSALAE
ncbi:non-homologous end-joining DNA ligase [Phaeacidiphilus oryzae]|uniref:non-homologous end-joining DNA ligase n=1 Tax=Phaeacidiphilus oryzae TaxID=348818 RepID=UPI00055D8BB7|nr:non-homologous end-joining DNA ligase [Phaeacidiphilus oryzae]